jgi:hypothetical protein
MTVTQFCSLTDLSASQVTALREAGVISPDLPPDQAGRARLIQTLKAKGIPLSKLVNLTLPPGAAYVVFDHSGHRLDTFADAGRALARAAAAALARSLWWARNWRPAGLRRLQRQRAEHLPGSHGRCGMKSAGRFGRAVRSNRPATMQTSQITDTNASMLETGVRFVAPVADGP